MFSENGFAIDTNLFIFPAARRLLHGIALETGKKIFLLPEVEREITERRRICTAEVVRWRRRRKMLGTPILAEQAEAIAAAIEAASLDWYAQELMRPNAVFRRVELTDGQAQNVERIAQSLPKEFFKGLVEGEPLEGDPLIVAQAIFCRVDLLSTNNLNTIHHEQLNTWLRSKGGWNHDLIHTPSQTVQEICGDDIQRVYQYFIAHGTNRVSEQEPENRTEFVRALNVLSSAGFGDWDENAQESDAFKSIVYRVDAEFRYDRHFQDRFQDSVASSHRPAAIKSEIRLNELVNQAVSEAESAWAGEGGELPGRFR